MSYMEDDQQLENAQQASDSAGALQKRHSTVPVKHRDFYAPGPIRQATDTEFALVSRFRKNHPEYAGMSHEAVLQIAETYRDEDDHAVRDMLADEGVPVDEYGAKHNFDISDNGPTWSDDQ